MKFYQNSWIAMVTILYSTQSEELHDLLNGRMSLKIKFNEMSREKNESSFLGSS